MGTLLFRLLLIETFKTQFAGRNTENMVDTCPKYMWGRLNGTPAVSSNHA
jgi:hypothetical protein